MKELEFKGNWNVIKGKLRKAYAELTDDDLAYVKGQEEELLGRLQKKVGKTREEIRKEIDEADAYWAAPLPAPDGLAPSGGGGPSLIFFQYVPKSTCLANVGEIV